MAKHERTQTKPFAAFLQEQRQGGLAVELSELLADTVAAVSEHQKAGTVTLTVKIKPAGENAVSITDEVKCKAPEGDKPSSLFFADDEGNLSRRDPRQPELPLRRVGGEPAPEGKAAVNE